MRLSALILAQALLGLLLAPGASYSQTITDGDTLKLNGVTYRLWGIDAPEAKQDCPDGWPAGHLAATHLQSLISGHPLICERKDTDRFGRTVAICRAGGEDLGALMVRDGYAWAFLRYSADYAGQEALAKREGLGVHRHGCQPAWEWRQRERAKYE
ncbi:thermonuclease family protein [uncultured Reyranella sp.]|uniref:thermonuclease family protein n=1 Tax=uncultured Reyranella sp. TaxID=735512 RepID=UPI0025E986CD|nr:thermonuclease family protein [uncultured Reyranella sp.]